MKLLLIVFCFLLTSCGIVSSAISATGSVASSTIDLASDVISSDDKEE